MSVILGIDLGTQSVKAMLLDTEKGCVFSDAAGYEILIPEIDYAEQRPEDWWNALKSLLDKMKLSNRREFDSIEAIGFSGQMHGLVALDENNQPVCNAIIWVDQRSGPQVEKINSLYSFRDTARLFHNRPFTGFGVPSLLWIKELKPDVYRKIRRICSPKDYIRAKLTGDFSGTDMSDASSMFGFDFEKRDWNYDELGRMGLDRSIFPQCHEAFEIAGTVCAEASAETGLKKGIRAVYGCGDLAAMMLGCGAYREGISTANIGTSANYNCCCKTDIFDPELRMQEFCNAIDKSYLLAGAILSGGLSLSWLRNKILEGNDYDSVNSMAAQINPGSDGVIFLPYLGGERAPHMDYNASGMFFGLKHIHDKRHMIRAVLEGVTFALKDAERLIEDCGIKNDTVVSCGGGARSPLWMQIQSDIFEKEVIVTEISEQASLGACLIAGIGTGIFSSAEEACLTQVRYKEERYCPNSKNFEVYRHRYQVYHSIYPCVKELMHKNNLI